MRMHGRQNEKKKKNDEFFLGVHLYWAILVLLHGTT